MIIKIEKRENTFFRFLKSNNDAIGDHLTFIKYLHGLRRR